jgi:glycosyltransferase involved in cell wall biosynthesis
LRGAFFLNFATRVSEGGRGSFGNRCGGLRHWQEFRLAFENAGLFHGQVISAGLRCPELMKWLCCQLGAREHYAIPRALFRLSMLDQLLTDAWVPPSSFLAKLSRSRLADRFDDELRDAHVISFNSSLILFETATRTRHLTDWQTIIARNRWFQRKVVSHLRCAQLSTLNSQPILLSYSYTALECFRYAGSRGWKTVLAQIDPGPEEERIVAEEAARVPELAGDWQPAPAEYWASWRKECELADRILVNSEWSREGLMRSGVPGEKLSVIPLAYEGSNATYARSYPASFTKERPIRVLFLGQVNLRKGVARLLDAARMLRDEPVEFWIVGPLQVSNAMTTADEARMKWFGPVTQKQAAERYRAADVFILPTLSDGFAITQLEAQAHGLPVITSRFCGGVIESGRNGIVLEEPSAACIAAAVRDCIADPNRLQNFTAASRVANGFTIDALAQRLQELAATL